MRALFLSLAVLALPLTGCDSGGDDDDDGGGSAVSCETVGLVDGTLTGSATTGTLTANCFGVDASIGLDIVAFEIRSLSQTPRATLLLDFNETTPATYSVGGDDDDAFASYNPTSSASGAFEAASGTITLTEFSPTRVRGAVDFVTVNGIEVEGSFSVSL